MLAPHDIPPLRIGHGLDVPLEQVFAEAPARAPEWMPLCYSRLLLSSFGPVVVSRESHPLAQWQRERLERARWPVIAADADEEAARLAYWPTLPTVGKLGVGVGSAAPDLVLVGERDARRKDDERPFLSRAGFWLFRALRELGYDELSVYACNAIARGGERVEELRQLADALERYDPTWVALGKVAHVVLNRARIDHVRTRSPAWHRRWRYYGGGSDEVNKVKGGGPPAEGGPKGYADMLRKDGVPPGPWWNAELPVHKVDDVTELVHKLGLPSSVAFRKQQTIGTDSRSEAVNVERLEVARRAYVTAECKTLSDAAKMIGVSPTRLYWHAREQEWELERDRYREEVRQRVYAEQAAAEAKAKGQARKAFWAGTNLAIKDVIERMRLPDDSPSKLHPKVAEACALSHAALELSEMADVAAETERESLGEKPWPELARELNKITIETFGAEALRAGVEDGCAKSGEASEGAAPPAMTGEGES